MAKMAGSAVRRDEVRKELGSVEVVVHIHRDIDVTLPVRVVRPGEDPNAAAPEFVAEGALEVSEEVEVAQAIEEGIETTAFHVVSEPEPEPETEHEPEPEVEAESMDADELPKIDTDSDPR